ncbi:lysylphosphatidylglycerol synthase domain-containing protein [Nostocoides sp. HKS02]|uniref:lysylphosphatidylglycerol synthase domain-containing protein n=1 Tax=Nostocoides sp. HKS02 TaxID=1813880 RepID=UPI001E31F8BB|nr:lysylphosphatidylglycerol synthase domain-containing protein [Tetrasphaera sp. HKS02]
MGRSADVPATLADAAIAATITGLVILTTFISMVASERAALAIGQGIDRLAGRLFHRRSMSVRALVVDLRARINEVVRTGWLKMTLGLVGYFGIYYLLFLLCMHTTGVHLFYGQLFAAYAIGRLATAVGVTPGGLGVTESVTVAALVAWGAGHPEAVAGAVLFSVFTHVLEVPLGALGWLAWSLSPKQAPADNAAHHLAS